MNRVFTVGFTEKSAEHFFGLIKSNSINVLFDTRINNVSQLAGFAKNKDLSFFLKELCGTEYIWEPKFAPTKDMLSQYRSKEMEWGEYELRYKDLICKRNVEACYPTDLFIQSCLLCSEHLPHHCHRKILVDYLNEKWEKKMEVVHLL